MNLANHLRFAKIKPFSLVESLMNLANHLRFAKIKPFNLVELGKLLYESNVLHITNYFYEEVIYVLQLYITLSTSNSVILLLLSK